MVAVNGYSDRDAANNNTVRKNTQQPPKTENEEVDKNVEIKDETSSSGSNSIFDKPFLLQDVSGDSSSVNKIDTYIYGGLNPSLAAMRVTNPVQEDKIDSVLVKVAPNVNVYNSNIYDKDKRLTQTITGAEVTLHENKVKDDETGLDKTKSKLSAYYEYLKPQHGEYDPVVTYGLDYTFDNSSVKKKVSTNARNLNKEGGQQGKFEINTEWDKNTGLNKVSFGAEVGHGTMLKVGKEGEFRTAGLTHEKKSKNSENNIQEEVQMKYMDNKNFSLSYSVDNKGITKWGLSAEKQEGINRFGVFFNKLF